MLLVSLGLAAPAGAHEVRPAYLEITALGGDEFSVLWKQPLRSDQRLRIDPVLPAICTERSRQPSERAGGALLQRAVFECPGGLVDQAVGVSGLDRTLVDVLVRVSLSPRADPAGEGQRDAAFRSAKPGSPTKSAKAAEPGKIELTQLLRPGDPPWVITLHRAPAVPVYLRLGIEHLLFGFDHILFIVGLVLLVRTPRQLLFVVTSFTAAHSMTLALSSLALVRLPPRPVEACIALSIVLVAHEALVPRPGLARRFPWLVAFLFGLLHGFGFAGALAEIGLPQSSVGWALLLFNVGLELGQLALVGLLLVLAVVMRGGRAWLLGRGDQLGNRSANRSIWEQAGRWPAWLMGGVATFWFFQRAVLLVG